MNRRRFYFLKTICNQAKTEKYIVNFIVFLFKLAYDMLREILSTALVFLREI